MRPGDRNFDTALADKWLATVQSQDAELVARVADLITTHNIQIAETFYHALLHDPDSLPFLDHELVRDRLRASMAAWVCDLFEARSPDAIAHQIERNAQIGETHARLNIPMVLVSKAFRLLGHQIDRILCQSELDREHLAGAVRYAGDILAHADEVMSSSYINDMLSYARHEQAYRMFSLGQNLGEDFERLRASLLDWLRGVLLHSIAGRGAGLDMVASVSTSDFGLWLNHKAEGLFAGAPELDQMRQKMVIIDSVLSSAVQHDGEPVVSHLATINGMVDEVLFLLRSLTDRTLQMEGGKDQLTRLLNRRFLPPIIQREVNISLRRGIGFAVLLLDLDHFKRINDTHGHDVGDMVLRHFAEILTGMVRAVDFVFRYGGEEFLILLAEVDRDTALGVAEKIRERVAGEPLRITGGRHIRATVSIGLAVHDGHPDYTRVIAAADRALYRAKSGGRNRVECAKSGDSEPERES